MFRGVMKHGKEREGRQGEVNEFIYRLRLKASFCSSVTSPKRSSKDSSRARGLSSANELEKWILRLD